MKIIHIAIALNSTNVEFVFRETDGQIDGLRSLRHVAALKVRQASSVQVQILLNLELAAVNELEQDFQSTLLLKAKNDVRVGGKCEELLN